MTIILWRFFFSLYKYTDIFPINYNGCRSSYDKLQLDNRVILSCYLTIWMLPRNHLTYLYYPLSFLFQDLHPSRAFWLATVYRKSSEVTNFLASWLFVKSIVHLQKGPTFQSHIPFSIHKNWQSFWKTHQLFSISSNICYYTELQVISSDKRI